MQPNSPVDDKLLVKELLSGSPQHSPRWIVPLRYGCLMAAVLPRWCGIVRYNYLPSNEQPWG